MSLKSFIRYVISGVVALGTHLAVLYSLVEFVGVNEVVASAVGFLVACGVNFAIQSTFVFEVGDRKAVRLTRYAIITSATFVLNAVCFYLMLKHTNLHYTLVQVITTGFIFVVNFVLNALWTFKPSNEEHPV